MSRAFTGCCATPINSNADARRKRAPDRVKAHRPPGERPEPGMDLGHHLSRNNNRRDILSDSLFGTMKYTPALLSNPFESLAAAREWVHGFVLWYNEAHRHSGIQFLTPGERHRSEDQEILAKRKDFYEAANERNPQRWSGETRNW